MNLFITDQDDTLANFGGDDLSRTSSAFRAAGLQPAGVTNFPTSPNIIKDTTLLPLS